ncbi:NRAMP family divalent metal transporter [Actinoallomurus iriomotensis]|uniref:Divalent metal cation transporter n=1 Tax=Actinoallomurus iriomotensis TaxID=478107 RepID=A0A9W6RWW0_9ACTN|nr:NRAMP family divalent metal transporter [Actinoallomurus iriomotensis]GLY75068.1 hypothetical protein Airi01_033350 [Actinoallomurus iriomotensis]GLY83284.1 hypothetical protein Airi02_012140 [Actinoallomurus iriomotensis]
MAKTASGSPARGPAVEDGGTRRWRVPPLLGAALLMAITAAGPGFITQTATFTSAYGASFACAVVISLIIDLAIQTNIWRVVGLSGMRAQDLANKALPGSGHVLTVLIVFGGLILNLGNISGAGLGLHELFGLNVRIGVAISGCLAIAVFTAKAMNAAVDRVVVVLGGIKIALIIALVLVTAPPVGEAAVRTVAPHSLPFLPILTLIGGTVGGFITYSGAHRLIDDGITGVGNLKRINRGSLTGVLVASVLRIVLFLGFLGVVYGGVKLSKADPAGSAFGHAFGSAGERLFGLVFWCASMTSMLGCSYTSISFLQSLAKPLKRRFHQGVMGFMAITTVLFLVLGQAPAKLLVFAGAVNGLILPIGLAILLWVAIRRRDLIAGGAYRYPVALIALGAAAWIFTVYAGVNSLSSLGDIFH